MLDALELDDTRRAFDTIEKDAVYLYFQYNDESFFVKNLTIPKIFIMDKLEERKMQTSYEEQIQAFSKIKSKKNKFGVFHKTCFHIHTPESHDYCLLDSWNTKTYKSKSDQDILEACHVHKVFPVSITLNYFDDSLMEGFKDKKEMLSFLIVANEIFVNEISIVIVADHNTIAGVPKLKKAIEYLNNMKTRKIYPEVLLGMEISCADRNHVVGIFDNTNKVKSDIATWLDLHLFNEIDGSFETSKEGLEFINSEGGIGCIAVIISKLSRIADTFEDSSNIIGIFKDKRIVLNVIELGEITQENCLISSDRWVNALCSLEKDVKYEKICVGHLKSKINQQSNNVTIAGRPDKYSKKQLVKR